MSNFIVGLFVGIFLGICFMLGFTNEQIERFDLSSALIIECESNLPRNVKCILVAKPE